MKRLLIIALCLGLFVCFPQGAQAGGFGLGVNIFGGRGLVDVQVGRGFVPRQQVFVQRQPVFVQRQFVVPHQRVFVQRQFAPVYQQQFLAAPVYGGGFGFSSGYSVQSFAAPGCGALLAY